jgi:hypothetical protein
MDILGESTQEVIKYLLDPTIISPGFAVFWQTMRIIFISVSLFLIGLLIFLLSVNDYFEWRYAENYTELRKTKPRFRIDIKRRWKEVLENTQSNDDADRRLSVIDADDIFNEVLEKVGYVGDNTYDKLARLNENIIPNINEIKKAYEVKKEIMHDPNRNLEEDEAKNLVSRYEKALKDLQVI